jgi:hypothetical protein
VSAQAAGDGIEEGGVFQEDAAIENEFEGF